MQAYCPTCGDDTPMRLIPRRESYPVLGEPTVVVAQVALCTFCDHEVSVPAIDDATLQQAYDRYRSTHGLPPSQALRRSFRSPHNG